MNSKFLNIHRDNEHKKNGTIKLHTSVFLCLSEANETHRPAFVLVIIIMTNEIKPHNQNNLQSTLPLG